MKKVVAVLMVIMLASISLTSAFAETIAISGFGLTAPKVGSNILVNTYTIANQTADSVGGVVYLQRWDGVAATWSSISSYQFAGYGVSSKSYSKTLTPTMGYYYRIKVVHTASCDGDSVSKTEYSSSLNFGV